MSSDLTDARWPLVEGSATPPRLRSDAKRFSRWHLANEASVAWHRKLGFIEEPDLFNAQLYLRAAKQELWRLAQLGELTESRREPLLRSSEQWQREVTRLEALLDTGDKAAAFACHRFAS